ncbi:PQQ-dependent dehydrogenase, methanol/ethanol family [Methylobacterium oryzihabitans]|uniref:PQQ-dependent dehydrogenase, methanol/ethanol family n=1 Tax=Methylobacterium oryzihabitans TaxID=2499852 RepID=A0A3S2VIN6_9HYPH|nr:PQQ-dependent dehydrogenase, methanol/ethanol family [Methylobacterium oryzihabitans]RVU13820.1 PQQ-dependent dehydrogenase, methanol/ethanol family [Methylobacterium oryzihabitans]
MTRFSTRCRRALAAGTALALVTAAAQAQAPTQGAAPAPATGQTVDQNRLLKADKEEGNWLLHHKNFGAHRYSTLAQINRDTVKNLKVAWTMHLGGIEGGGIWSHGGLEGTPIVENGMMYVTDGWGSVYKIDTRNGAGKLLWKMDPKTDREWAGAVACCGVNNRGVALWGNQVISHTLDGRLIATDKETGQVAWQRQVADPDKGETITGAPLVVHDMAVSGVGGAEYGIRGWIAATDLKSQKEIWRTHTIPGKGEPGIETWKGPNNAEVSGGGSTWVTGSYDPDTDLIIWGVGNPGPDWDNTYRPGDNLYTDSTVALDAKTGAIKWHFQHTPNDPYDYDSVSENLLVDAGGKKMALEADRNGFAYAVDRTNGQFLWATPFVKKVTWTRGINPDTGKPFEYDPTKDVQRYNPAVTPHPENKVADVCPGNMGGKNWPPTAYHPGTGLWYIPVIESCNRITHETMTTASLKPREFFTGGGPTQPFRITGSVTAIDVNTGKVAAKLETPFPLLGGMLATPDLVFTGEPDGRVMALDAKTLAKMWEFNTGGGVNAPPMTFTVDGKQYLAILVGLGGAWDKWFIDSTPELKSIQAGSMLYVFAL